MSEIVLGVGASHSTLMNTHWHEVSEDGGALRFRAGLEKARDLMAAARPDVVVVLGSNHFRGMFLDLMPAYTVGVGEVLGAGEAGTPAGALPTDPGLARHVVTRLSENFDPAFSLRLTVDHGITHSLQHLIPALDVPVIPVVLNMFAPPLPSLRRCSELGRAIGDAIRDDGQDKRVVVIASGGLSHRLPWPKWFNTLSDDDRFLAEAWLNGRHSWKDYEVRRREIVRAAQPDINEEFDLELLAMFERGDTEPALGWTTDDVEERAGNGAQEIRAWLAMAAAVGPARGSTLAYAPIPQWLTGMAVSVLEPTSTVP
jgi:2,3-dihydroxyphenylpropionate 1,2-dioxygenase